MVGEAVRETFMAAWVLMFRVLTFMAACRRFLGECGDFWARRGQGGGQGCGQGGGAGLSMCVSTKAIKQVGK